MEPQTTFPLSPTISKREVRVGISTGKQRNGKRDLSDREKRRKEKKRKEEKKRKGKERKGKERKEERIENHESGWKWAWVR